MQARDRFNGFSPFIKGAQQQMFEVDFPETIADGFKANVLPGQRLGDRDQYTLPFGATTGADAAPHPIAWMPRGSGIRSGNGRVEGS